MTRPAIQTAVSLLPADRRASRRGTTRALRAAAALCVAAMLTLPGCGGLTERLAGGTGGGPVVSDSTLVKMRLGMTRDEVRAVLGPPVRVGKDPVTGQEEWLWRYLRHNIDEMCFFARFNEAGRVAGTASAREYQAGSPESVKAC